LSILSFTNAPEPTGGLRSAALLTESYSRAYDHIVQCQKLAELEEVCPLRGVLCGIFTVMDSIGLHHSLQHLLQHLVQKHFLQQQFATATVVVFFFQPDNENNIFVCQFRSVKFARALKEGNFYECKPPLIKVHPPCLFHARIEVHPGPPKKTVQIEVHPRFEGKSKGKWQKGWITIRIEVHPRGPKKVCHLWSRVDLY